MPKRKKSWSFSAGERGLNKVRAFVHQQTGLLFLEFTECDALTGVRHRRRVALGHREHGAAKAAAETLAARLRTAAPAVEPELVLGALFDSYDREVTPTKAPSTQTHDRRTLPMFLKHLGGRGRRVRTLDRRDWDSFIRERRAGRLKPITPSPKRKRRAPSETPRPVRDRIIEQDLRLLMAVFNWAALLRTPAGEPVLERNPFVGFEVPKEQSPNRPLVSPQELADMLAVADRVNPSFALLLSTAYYTGHRIGAVTRLRWSDFDLEAGRVRWRAEHDKIGFEHDTPLAEELVALLRAAQRVQGAIGAVWIFPDATDPTKPVSREIAHDWWQSAESLAGVKRVTGRAWHGLRRRFATDNKHLPLKDLAALGGWKTWKTLLECYIQPDEVTMREALGKRPPLPKSKLA